MAEADVCSKAVGMLLIIQCLLLLPFLWGSVFDPCFVIQYFVSFLFCNHLDVEANDLVALL